MYFLKRKQKKNTRVEGEVTGQHKTESTIIHMLRRDSALLKGHNASSHFVLTNDCIMRTIIRQMGKLFSY